jgi:4-hydroxy-tetrahydrodipicolinate synthase
VGSTDLFGIVPILVTPFDDQGRLDIASLRRLVDFTIAAGVHGVGIALGSEVYKLTEAERDRVIETVIEQTNGRVPVVVNTGAAATDLAVIFSQRAQAQGATAVMCALPGAGYSTNEILSYFGAIARAVDVPVMIQDTSVAPVPGPVIRAIGDAYERVRYAKVESVPPPVQVYAAVQSAGEVVKIFGGAAGQYLLPELRRGSIGTMPWPSTPGAFVKVWDLWHSEQHDEAETTFEQAIAPLLRISVRSLGGGHIVHKLALQRQGIIDSAYVRGPCEELDPITLAEIDEACRRIGLYE